MAFQRQFSIDTHGHRAMHDLTEAVAQIVEESGIKTGVAHVFNVGSTAALGTIEFEPGLRQDLPALNGSSRQIPLHGGRIVCRKGELIKKEMIANEDRRDHGFTRYNRSLRNTMSENPRKNDC